MAQKANAGPSASLRLLKRKLHGGSRRLVGLIMNQSGLFPHDLPTHRLYEMGNLRFQVCLSNAYEKSRWDRMVARTKEPETLDWIERTLQPGEVFVDIGANIGNYSLYAALAHPGLRVFAFEPEPQSFAQLVRNIRINELDVTSFLLPLGSRPKFDFFYTNHEFMAGESNHQFGRTLDSGGNRFRPTAKFGVCGTSLDELVRAGAVPAPNHVKIDVDGLESEVLKGMNDSLLGPELRSVLCEISGGPEEVAAIEDYLSTRGMSCRTRPPPGETTGNYIFERNVPR